MTEPHHRPTDFPAEEAPSDGAPPARAGSRSDAPWFWPGLGVATSVVTLLAGYLILRFAPSPFGVALGVVGALLIALAVLGFLATRRGHAPAFVAIALLMPYLLFGVVSLGGAQRAVEEIDSFMEEDLGGDAPSEEFLEALQEDCLAGDTAACEQLYLDAPVGSSYEKVAEDNDGG